MTQPCSTKAKVLPSVSGITLQASIHENVEGGSEIHTDEHSGYDGLGYYYMHETVNHGVGEYSRKGVTTNGMESVWAAMKRGIHGVYHHASPKHIARYVDEFTFRLNDGRPTLERRSTKSRMLTVRLRVKPADGKLTRLTPTRSSLRTPRGKKETSRPVCFPRRN